MQAEERQILYVDSFSNGPNLNLGFPLEPGGWRVRPVHSLDDARRLLDRHRFRVGVVEMAPGHEDRISEIIEEIGKAAPFIAWVAVIPGTSMPYENTAFASLIAEHFFDYHTLPIDLQRFSATLGHAFGMSRAMESAAAAEGIQPCEDEMVGASPIMLDLFRSVRKVAASDVPVFITGESGTGKELTARAIHERSLRRSGPFVAVDCGAIPPTLIQSELFGYERGAFTGASQRKLGRIELAAGGTVFLDEIGDLPLELQCNLLRFLQESTICRVGSLQYVKVDARVIAATHVDLEEAVRLGRFRQDLYYRLNVLRLRVPALRERVEDIELLAKYFLKSFAREGGRSVRGFTSHAIEAMNAYQWPGNVRELINRIRRAMVMCSGRMITPADLELDQAARNLPGTICSLDDARAMAEKQVIEAALKYCNKNVSCAAKSLGVSRVTLYRLLEKHHIAAANRGNGPGEILQQ